MAYTNRMTYIQQYFFERFYPLPHKSSVSTSRNSQIKNASPYPRQHHPHEPSPAPLTYPQTRNPKFQPEEFPADDYIKLVRLKLNNQVQWLVKVVSLKKDSERVNGPGLRTYYYMACSHNRRPTSGLFLDPNKR